MSTALRPYVTAGVALVGAGIITVSPTATPLPRVDVPDIQLTGADATDPTDIVIDILRHGQRLPPQNLEVTPSPDYPGPPLSDLGQQQAHDVGQLLANELGTPGGVNGFPDGGVAGIFSGEAIRDMDTAAPFAANEGMSDQMQILPGINELDSGIFANFPLSSPGGLIPPLVAAVWTLGFPLFSVPGTDDMNGVIPNEKFTDAVDAMYNAAMANPVVSADGNITDVAFNNELDLLLWVTLNVKNDDVPFFVSRAIEQLKDPAGNAVLPNTGIVQIEGNPTDGWTLVNWNGTAIPDHPGLLSDLFVDFRDAVVPGQIAEWNLFEAALSGDPTTIENALQTGFSQANAALAQYPESVLNTISYYAQHPGSAFAGITEAIQYLSTAEAGQAAGETGATAGDAVGSAL